MLVPSYDVTEAEDGRDAVERIRDGGAFDAVLMDVEMPRLNGREAFLEIARIAPALAARTLVMTGGSGDAELLAWFQELGAGRSLLKPFSSAVLHQALSALLAQ